MQLSFSKYHGAGNDFILVDNREDKRTIWEALIPETIRRLCERHHGIGADGLLMAVRSKQGETPYSMAYFNADGTLAEMCGNGLRCLLRFLADLGEPVRDAGDVRILTGAGVVTCRFTSGDLIQVDMPIPSFDPREAKIITSGETICMPLAIPGLPDIIHGTAVGVGNPHFVIYNNEMWEGEDVHECGSRISLMEEVFPQGVNVGFARKEDATSLALVVWERGVGPTLACGSGAVAAVAAGIAESRFPFDTQILVRMPGGDLQVTIGEDWKYALLEGDATSVFEGKVEI